MNGSEKWALTVEDERRLNAAQMKDWQAPEVWTRPRDRLPIGWDDTVQRQLNRVGIGSLEETNRIAQDRVRWRDKISSLRDVQVYTIPATSTQSSVDTYQRDPTNASR